MHEELQQYRWYKDSVQIWSPSWDYADDCTHCNYSHVPAAGSLTDGGDDGAQEAGVGDFQMWLWNLPFVVVSGLAVVADLDDVVATDCTFQIDPQYYLQMLNWSQPQRVKMAPV